MTDATRANEAVPAHVRQRLATVLSHLHVEREAKNGGACGYMHQSSCSAAGGSGDIEDLASKLAPGRKTSGDYADDNVDRLFNPDRFAATQQPLLQATMLPSEPYSSRRWFDREMERVFMRSWSIVGRGDEIEEPGSYLAIDTNWGGPVVVCRGNDGKLHAFANVCLHRGAKVMPDGKGKASKLGLVCPYHAWTYDFDGSLKFAPGMHATKNFEEEGMQLAPVRMEEWNGFIFVCSSPEAPSFKESIGDLPEKLPEWFGPEGKAKDMVCVARAEYEVPCNWKFIFENTCETYHTSVVHKGSLGPMRSAPMEPHKGDWDGVRVPSSRTVVPLPEDFEGQQFPLPAFTDRTVFTNFFPSLQMNVTWDCLWWMYVIPEGPEKSKISMGFVFPKDSVGLPEFPEVLAAYKKRWHIAVSEDNAISLNQQRGVRSVHRVPGRYGQLEFGVHSLNNWLLCRMLDGQTGRWDPGSRVFVGDGELYSNNDRRMLELAAEAQS